MTAHRNPRRRQTIGRQLVSNVREPIAAGILLTENPNRQPRVLPMAQPTVEDTCARSREYAPLTVSTPIRRARGNVRLTSYTI